MQADLRGIFSKMIKNQKNLNCTLGINKNLFLNGWKKALKYT